MARNTDVFDVGLRITGDPEIAKKLQQSLAPAIANFSTDFSKSVAKVAKGLSDDLTETTAKFAKGFASPDQIRRMEQAFYKGTEPIWQAMEKARKLEKALTKQLTDDHRKVVMEKLKQLKDYTQKYESTFKHLAKREMDKDTAVFEHKKKLADDYNEWFAKSLADKTEDVVEGIGKGIRDVVSLNFKDALRGGGGILTKMGAGMAESGRLKKEAAQAGGGSGGMGKMMEMLGGFLGKAGAVIGVIGGIAGGLAMIVKLLLDADAQTKEFNRDLVNTAGGLAMVGKSGAEADDRLNELRKAAINSTAAIKNLGGISSVIKLGLTAKEYMEVTSKFEEMGVTFEKMRGDAKNLGEATENYTKYVKAAASISRNFGMSLGEATEKISEHMNDLNLNLDEVKEGFAAVGKAAQESGYGTKRFFNMVLQATSGVTMYNVRLGATAKLLSNLVRVLGLKVGGDMLKDLTTKLQGESYEDRYKRILTTGGGLTGKVIGKEAERQSAGIQRDITEELRGKLTPNLSAGAEAGLAAAQTGDIKQLAAISNKDRAVLIAAMSKQDEALARRLDNLIDLAKGTRGDIASQAKALEKLGPGGAIVMELNRMQAVLHKPLHELADIEPMAFQKMTGLSAEQIDQLQKVARTVSGDFELAKDAALRFKGDADAEAKWNEENKKSGMKIEDGMVKSVETNTQIKDTNDALMAWSRESHAEDLKAMDEQAANSERIAENTYDLANLYSQSMVALLEDISGYVNDILIWLGLKDDPSDRKKAAQEEMSAMEKRQQEVSKKQEETNEILKGLREKRKGAISDDTRKEIDAAIKKAEETRADLKAEQTNIRTRKQTAKGLFTGYDTEGVEIYNKARGGGASAQQAATYALDPNRKGLLEGEEKAKQEAMMANLTDVRNVRIQLRQTAKINREQAAEALKQDEEDQKKEGFWGTTGRVMSAAFGGQSGAQMIANANLSGAEQAESLANLSDEKLAEVMSKDPRYKNYMQRGIPKQSYWAMGNIPQGAPAADASPEDLKKIDMAGNEWMWDKTEGSWKKQDTAMKKLQKATDDNLDQLKKLNEGITKQTELTERQDIVKALHDAGISDATLAPLSAATDKAAFNKLLEGLETGETTKEAFKNAKVTRLKDGLAMGPLRTVTADGTVIEGSPGDAALLFNVAAMKGGGKRGGGGANVVFNINATEGREDIVTAKVQAGLEAFYNGVVG